MLAQKAQLSSYFYPDSMSVFIPHHDEVAVRARSTSATSSTRPLTPAAQDIALRQVRELLATRHRFDPRDERAVRADDQRRDQAVVDGMAGGLMVVLVFIGSLTLLIGGVGVMNIMLVSVHGAHARDRRPQGARRQAPPHPRAVPARGAGHHLCGRPVGIALSYASSTSSGCGRSSRPDRRHVEARTST